VPAIALSQHINPEEEHIHWETALEWAPDIITKLIAEPWPKQVLMNVNFPARKSHSVKGIHVVRHGKRDYGDNLNERFDPRGRRYFWIGTLRAEGDTALDTDVGQVFDGSISITPLCLNLTDDEMLLKLQTRFKE
jgi:5'-nucleotidase